MPSKWSNSVRWTLGIAIVAAVIGLAMIGDRLAPPQQGPSGSQSTAPCKMEAPDDTLHAAAKLWCANGLFSRVSVTGDKENVIAVAQFSANGFQIWQIQNAGLLATFPGLTERLAGAAKGRHVSVDVHDAADRRIAICARLSTDASAKCEMKN